MKLIIKNYPLNKLKIKIRQIRQKNIFYNKRYNQLGYNQINNKTRDNRYPEIFTHISTVLSGSNLKLLSFGCSLGLECFSLRKYFDTATIIGYDINNKNIIKANEYNKDSKILFYSDWNKVNRETYDVVFAMSVLCRWPGTQAVKNCSKIYSFTQFNDQVEQLDALLREGGVLIIYNANFRFTDTLISKKYNAIKIPGYTDSGPVSKFSIDNQYLKDQRYEYSIFEKIKCKIQGGN
jgi:SAM-dependent methyltransferase